MPARISIGGRYHDLKELSPMDVRWLRELADGRRLRELSGKASEQVIKNRFERIRMYLGVRTTTQAVAEAIRRRIIR